MQPQRSLAVDALRGLAILMMIFSGRIPFGVLPDWMYHAQVPPPTHKFNPLIPGITWVDLVFPFFLFTMGMAIPLALSKRTSSDVPWYALSWTVLSRSLLLAWFAMYVMQIRPWLFASPLATFEWLFCLLGFLFLFPMLARFPDSWSKPTKIALRVLGWSGAIFLMYSARFDKGAVFSFAKSDIIILVLANVYLAGAFIWLLTRKNTLAQIGMLAILLGLRLSKDLPGFAQEFWNISPVPWLFRVDFLKYLFIIIPGIMAGNHLLEWMKKKDDSATNFGRSRYTTLAATGLLVTIVATVGLFMRQVEATALVSIALIAIQYLSFRKADSSLDTLLFSFIRLSLWLLLIGFAFEGFEGGIKKDHSTISYYLITSALALQTLLTLMVLIDVFGQRTGFRVIIGSGQNPLIAYAGVNSFLPPVLALIGVSGWIEEITAEPLLGVLRGAVMTYLVAWVATFCTDKKIFLKT